jgi:O-antigen/teichoic acid export membrane protein
VTTPPGQLEPEDASRAVVQRMFGRDTAYLLLWAVQLLGAAALTPVISRLLSVGAFGQVAAVNAVMQVLFVVTGLGLANTLQRTYAQDEKGPEAALRLVSLLMLVSTGFTALAVVTGPLWAPALGFDGYPAALRLAVLWGGVSAATNGCLALLRSQDRLAAFAAVSLLQSVVAELLAVGLVLFGPATAARFVLGQLLAQVAALVLVGLRHRTMVRQAMAYGLPFVPATLGTFVLNASDRLVVQHQLGEVPVARYQIAYNVGAMPMLLIGVLNSSWLPRLFAVHDVATRSAVLAASRDALYRLLCPVLIGLALGAPLVLRVWAPESYRPDTLQVVTTIVIVSAVPYTAGLAASRALLSAGHSRAVATATVLAAVTNLGLNVVLVPRAGLSGSALATLIAYTGLHLMLLRAVPRELRVARPTVRLLGALAVCSAAAMLVAAAAPISTGGLVVRTVAAVACLAWFGWEVMRVTGRRGTVGR